MIQYVVTHKQFSSVCKKECYVPLLVGADSNSGEENWLKDNTGDNISFKNKSFCELTGIYWIWKNSKEDIVGICHYRRYFTLSRRLFPKIFFLTRKNIVSLLKVYDIILPKRSDSSYNGYTAKEFFAIKHDRNVWDKCREIIQSKCPDYLEDFEWFSSERSGYCYNMMICNKQWYDSYCEWLFEILFELEKYVDISAYDNYNVRMFGFVSERLVNVWLHHNKLKTVDISVYFVDETPLPGKAIRKFKNLYENIKQKIN